MKIIYTFLISLPIIFAFDMLWLGLFAKDYYNRLMSPLLTIKFYWPAVILFYLVYLVGVFFFAIYPGILDKDLAKTLMYAAMFGFFCYATYDLTNLATIKDWPLQLVIVDILWGMALSTFTAFVGYKVYFFLS